MRLIDADALTEEITSLRVTVNGLRAGKGVLSEYAKQYRESVVQVIEDAPTVDAVSVVHGHWNQTYKSYKLIDRYGRLCIKGMTCSNCSNEDGNDFFIYCPNCGAKMDEEVE